MPQATCVRPGVILMPVLGVRVDVGIEEQDERGLLGGEGRLEPAEHAAGAEGGHATGLDGRAELDGDARAEGGEGEGDAKTVVCRAN